MSLVLKRCVPFRRGRFQPVAHVTPCHRSKNEKWDWAPITEVCHHSVLKLTPSLTMLLLLPRATDGGCALGGGPLLGLAELAPSALKTGSDSRYNSHSR